MCKYNCSSIYFYLESMTKEELLQVKSELDKKLNINRNNYLRLEDEEVEFINSILKK